MTYENMARADLWDLAVALYKTSLSADDVAKWDRHAAAFASHELAGSKFTIGVADEYAADYYSGIYSEPLRIALYLYLFFKPFRRRSARARRVRLSVPDV